MQVTHPPAAILHSKALSALACIPYIQQSRKKKKSRIIDGCKRERRVVATIGCDMI